MHIERTALIVRSYDDAIEFFVDALGFDDFDAARDRMLHHGVEFVTEPRDEPYGRVAVFVDVAGNRWDLLGPPPT